MKATIMTVVSRFVSLAIAAVDVPVSRTPPPAMSHLAAIGMLIAQRDANGDWRFSLRSHAIGAGQSEDVLIAWASEAMPPVGIVIGWQLGQRIVPPLLDAGVSGDPETGRTFLDRLSQLVTMPSVDLAVHHGGAGADPMIAVAERHGIVVPDLTVLDIESAWAFGNRSLLTSYVEELAIASWRLWLAEANGAAGTVTAAFEQWISRSHDGQGGR